MYGTDEVGRPALGGRARDGLHWMEDVFIVEVADVDTDATLPEGAKGNCVITSLYRHHPPLIRYNLRDYIRIVSDGRQRCACGSYTRRLDHFLGRREGMVQIRGMNVIPIACERTDATDHPTAGDMRVRVGR